MFDFLKLKKEVSEITADIEPDDVLSVKQKLKGLGYYKEPEWGMAKFTDNQMFDGIRNFQKDNKLKIDGIMKPDGETQNKINSISKEPVSKDNSYFKNLSNWNNKRKNVEKMKLSDENKHQYMSCLAGKGGVGMAATGLGAGVAKEVYDFSYKTLTPEQRKKYHGVMGVALDGGKDMVNNLKGLKHGYIDNKDCYNLLKKKLP